MSSLATFFIASLGVTLGAQLPAALAKLGVIEGPFEAYMPLAMLGAFGPLLAALWLSRRRAGGGGVRELFQKKGHGRVASVWYLIALGLLPAVYLSAAAAARLRGVELPWFFPPENVQHITGALIIPLAEEPGWRGFALVRLERRLSPVTAALALGVLWAAWHTNMFIVQDMVSLFPVLALNLVAGSVLFSWLYRRSEGSLWCAVLAHAGAHLCNPYHALPGSPSTLYWYTGATCVWAVLVVALDRRAWTSPPF